MVFFTTFTCSLLVSALYATATPLKGRDDVSPPITSPSGSGIVWKIGATETVTWCVGQIRDGTLTKPLHRDTSAIPEPLMNGGGVLVLGTIDSSGEHLDLSKHPPYIASACVLWSYGIMSAWITGATSRWSRDWFCLRTRLRFTVGLTDNPLAKVTWKDAQVQITVPSVPDGGDYIVARKYLP